VIQLRFEYFLRVWQNEFSFLFLMVTTPDSEFRKSFLPISTFQHLDVRVRGAWNLLCFATSTYLKAILNAHRLWRGDTSCYDGLEKKYANRFASLMRSRLKMETIVHGDLPEKCQSDKRMLIIGNHPSMYGLFPLMDFVREHLSDNLLGLGKRGHLYDPFMLPPLFGWPLWFTKKVIFLHRNDHEKAMESIRKACSDLFPLGTGTVLFPCAHRMSERKLALNSSYWAEKCAGFDVKNWRNVLVPRSGGLMEQLCGVEDVRESVRIVDITSAEQAPGCYGSPLHIAVDELSYEDLLREDYLCDDPEGRVSRKEMAVRRKLMELWSVKEERIVGWRGGE
jgi:hypothetical protein